jgi:hypothetical protein
MEQLDTPSSEIKRTFTSAAILEKYVKIRE